MPILVNLTQDVMDRGKEPELGWSYAALTSVDELTTKIGVVYQTEWTIEYGPEKNAANKGLFVSVGFPAKFLGQAGGKPIKDTVYKFKNMIASLNGIKTDQLSPDQYDLEALKGKSCWIKIDLATWSDRQQITITDFSRDAEIPF